MADGWLRYFTDDRVQVYSAGTHPEKINIHAIRAMKIAGIDISHHVSNKIDDYKDMNFDFVITVCDNARKKCLYFPTSAKKIHKSFQDPVNTTGTDIQKLKVYMDVCDQLKEYFKKFAEENFQEKIEINRLDF